MRPARVLLVEDDLHTRRITTLALRARGIDVAESVDGFGALALAASFRPDLVLLDISLPGLSGIEIMERLRSELPDLSPRILVVTARAMKDDREAAREAGCHGYLTKPIDPFVLADEVERLLPARREP